jgi:hypothetical protein
MNTNPERSNKMADQGSKKRSKENGDKGKLEVPPVIIKGGSIEVEFPAVDFDDGDNHTKVKRAKHPHDTKILRIEVQDYQKKPIHSYTLPTNLNGKCLIYIWDDSV